MVKYVSCSRCKFIDVYILYWVCIQTSVSNLCDPKRSRPYVTCEVCHVGWCENIYLLTYSMEQSPSWEANLQLVKNFPAFMEPESPSPYPQVPATCPRFQLRDTFSRNTPPPGDLSGGVVYLRIVLSSEEASRLMGRCENIHGKINIKNFYT
jgi:hypothetical protein